MIIGTFSYDKKANSFKGDILTLSFRFPAVDITPTEKNGDKEPDYRVTARTTTGHVELGAAWKRTSEKGREFISVSLDAPLSTALLNAALFHGRERQGVRRGLEPARAQKAKTWGAG